MKTEKGKVETVNEWTNIEVCKLFILVVSVVIVAVVVVAWMSMFVALFALV